MVAAGLGGETDLVRRHREDHETQYRMEIILRWPMVDEEEWHANKVDEYAQQKLSSVQTKNGEADFLFGGELMLASEITDA